MRTGLIAKKIGMSRIYDDKGMFIPVTILEVKDCVILGQKSQAKHGYNAVQLGIEKAKVKNVSKPVIGFFKKLGIEPVKKIIEFRVDADNLLEVGKEMSVNHFIKDQFVDVSGISIGKGFAGVIKRHNFRSLRASHGVSLTHRSHGSTGNRQDPGRVFKGKKMAGHLGADNVTIQNLKIAAIDESNNLILVKGAVPGFAGSLITIQDAVKKKSPLNVTNS
ncbi:50S ribosomal protein L3 [Candidatus Hepatincolaceae symbiont of Richtersius coronifer]